METLEITAPDDLHLHVRDGDMLKAVLPHTTRIFSRFQWCFCMTLFVLVRTYLARVRGMRRVVRAHVYLDRCRVFLCHMKIFAALVLLRVDCILLKAQGHHYAESRAACQHCTAGQGVQRAGHGSGKPPKEQCTHSNQIHTHDAYSTLACAYAWTDAGAGTHTGTRTHTRIRIRIRTCTHTYALAHIHSLHRRTLSRSRRPSTYVRPFFPTQFLYLLSITILCICMYCTYL